VLLVTDDAPGVQASSSCSRASIEGRSWLCKKRSAIWTREVTGSKPAAFRALRLRTAAYAVSPNPARTTAAAMAKITTNPTGASISMARNMRVRACLRGWGSVDYHHTRAAERTEIEESHR
jgi:hypothetical protein